MAKAVVPMQRFRQKFGELSGEATTALLHELMAQFLHETKEAKGHKAEPKAEARPDAEEVKIP
jgi:hypothetical protein